MDILDIFKDQPNSKALRNYEIDILPIANWTVDTDEENRRVETYPPIGGEGGKIEINVKQTVGKTGKYCFTKYIFDNVRQTLGRLTYTKMRNLGFDIEELGTEEDYAVKLENHIKCMNGEGGNYEGKFNELIEKALCKMATETTTSEPFIQERIFYNANGAVSHKEIFTTDKTDPKSVSRLVLGNDTNTKVGNRYYSTDGAYFSTLISGTEPATKHAVLRGPGMSADVSLLNVVHTIYKDYYKDKPGYAITGSRPKTSAIMAAIAQRDPNPNSNCAAIPITKKNTELWKHNLTKQELLEAAGIDASSEPPPNVVMIPVLAKRHATLLFVDRTKDDSYRLADSSLAHAKITDQAALRPSVFGNLSKNITILTTTPLQITGCCSFWVDSLAEAVSGNSEYKDMTTIQTAFQDGRLWLEAAAIMSKTFDVPPTLETVKIFTANDVVAQSANYITFEIAEKHYGISTNCWKNKFINIENLKKILPEEVKTAIGNQLNEQIEKQKLIRPFEISINSCNKINQNQLDIFNQLIQKRKTATAAEAKKFDAFLGCVRRKIRDQMLKQRQQQPQQQQQQLRLPSIKWFGNVIKIIKVGENLTLEKSPISDIRNRYIGLNTHFAELTALMDQNPSVTPENLRQNEHYAALSNNNTKEKKSKILSPSNFDNFCRFFAETVAEFENKTPEERRKMIFVKKRKVISSASYTPTVENIKIPEVQSAFEDPGFENGELEQENELDAFVASEIQPKPSEEIPTQAEFKPLVFPTFPLISQPSVTHHSELDAATISFKTDDPYIFRDIEQIQITIPKGTVVDQEYIETLRKSIAENGFINDYTCPDCVSVKRKGKEEYEKMGQFTNKCIIDKYKERSAEKVRET
jgi:hypothetical protein